MDTKTSCKLDIGCGKFKKEGYIGIDILPYKGVDLVLDVEEEPLPCGDGTVDEIYCSHLIEHLFKPLEFFKEMKRVLKKGGEITVRYPIEKELSPGHVYLLDEFSFEDVEGFDTLSVATKPVDSTTLTGDPFTFIECQVRLKKR